MEESVGQNKNINFFYRIIWKFSIVVVYMVICDLELIVSVSYMWMESRNQELSRCGGRSLIFLTPYSCDISYG